MKKIIIMLILAIALISVSYANYPEITGFDSQTLPVNITMNKSYEITIPAYADILNVQLNIKGYYNTTNICYQETANISTDCGGLSDGKYSFDDQIGWTAGHEPKYAIDGNWSSYATAGANSWVYINYTVPPQYNGAVWTYGIGTTGTVYNLTINSSFLEYDSNRILLMAALTQGAPGYVTLYYMNVSGVYKQIIQYETANRFWEEAMYWNLSSYPKDVEILVNNTLVRNISGLLNSSTVNVDLNSTLIEDYIKINETIPMNIKASSWGILELVNLSIESTPSRIILNIYNHFGTELLSSVEVWENYSGSVTYENPYIKEISYFLNESNQTMNLTIIIQDNEFKHSNYTENLFLNGTTINKTINMIGNQLIFEFFQNSISTTTEGYVADVTKRYGFNGTSILIIQQNLSTGRVNARFNMIGGGSNWTQYYEYNNDGTTTVDEDIELIQNADWSAYIRVRDYQSAPLEDVIVRAEFSYHELNNWTYHKLLGQRLTDNDGYTFFVADSQSEVLLTVSKDGYEPQELLVTIGDEIFTRADPLEVYLKESTTGVLQNAWLYIQNSFSERNQSFYGMVVAKGRELVEIQTDYRASQGLSRRDITSQGDEHERYLFQLRSGIDFDDEGTDDIELLIYLDNTLWRSITITYDTETKNEILDIKTISASILIPLLAIVLILASYGMRHIIKHPNVGKWTFMIGGVAVGVINTGFAYLSFMCLFYFIAQVLKRVVIHD